MVELSTLLSFPEASWLKIGIFSIFGWCIDAQNTRRNSSSFDAYSYFRNIIMSEMKRIFGHSSSLI